MRATVAVAGAAVVQGPKAKAVPGLRHNSDYRHGCLDLPPSQFLWRRLLLSAQDRGPRRGKPLKGVIRAKVGGLVAEAEDGGLDEAVEKGLSGLLPG